MRQWLENLGRFLLLASQRVGGNSWHEIPLKGDPYEMFFPPVSKEGFRLLLLEGILQPSEMELGSEVIPLVARHRALYAFPNKEPLLKVWVETVVPERYQHFQSSSIREFYSVQKETDLILRKSEYGQREYYVGRRKDLSLQGLKGKESIGSGHIFFPDRNTVVTIQFFNTEYYSKQDPLPEMESFVRQVIDSVNSKS